MSEESIGALRSRIAGLAHISDDGVWPENRPIVEAFLCVASQWRTVSIGGGLAPAKMLVIGLDYQAVRVGLDADGIEVTQELWEGLRIMEAEAVSALNGLAG